MPMLLLKSVSSGPTRTAMTTVYLPLHPLVTLVIVLVILTGLAWVVALGIAVWRQSRLDR